MKVVIDLQSCQSGSRLGGIGRYSMSLTKALLEEGQAHDVHVILNNRLAGSIADIRRQLGDHISQASIVAFESISGAAELKGGSSFRTRAGELLREAFLRALKPDVVIIMSLFEGLGDDVVVSVPAGAEYKVAVILYDLIPLVQEVRYLTTPITRDHYMRKYADLQRADLLLSISDFSRTEGLHALGCRADKIVNISSAVSDYFRVVAIDADERRALMESNGIVRKFLLYVGSFDQRKNHKQLLSALGRIDPALWSRFQLVVVGNGWPAIYEELRDHAKAVGLPADSVVYVGMVDDDSLRKLYNLCHLFVFPSLFEGFGLPILEAMLCGAPAIGSNCTSIPEVVGRPDALFDPQSSESIAAKISEVLSNDDFRLDLIDWSGRHSQGFSWRGSARTALDAIEATFGSRTGTVDDDRARICQFDVAKVVREISRLPEAAKADEGALIEAVGAVAANTAIVDLYRAAWSPGTIIAPPDRKIGVVSTWNTKCGIATYSQFLFKEFPTAYTVFAPFVDRPLMTDEAHIVRCWRNGGSDDFEALMRGVTDSGITELIVQFNYGFFDFPALGQFICRLVDRQVRVFMELHSTMDPPSDILPRRLGDLSFALARCAAIFVHSEADRRRLADIGLHKNVKLLRHGVNRPAPIANGFEREPGDYVVSSYGFFLPHKGILQLVRAFAQVSLTNRRKRLLLVNAEYPAQVSADLIQDARRLVDALGLTDDVVFVTDFHEDAYSLGLLQKSDIVVFPYQVTGESASGAIRLGLAAAKPVLTTPLTIFDDVRDLVLMTASSNTEDLCRALEDFANGTLMSPQQFHAYGERVALWLRTNSYRETARQLFLEVCSGKALEHVADISRISATNEALRTVVGTRGPFGLRNEGRNGILAFGPYLDLVAGDYDLAIFGSRCELMPGADFRLYLRHTDGTFPIEFVSLPRSEGVLMSISFNIAMSVRNFEIQVDCDRDSYIEIEHLSIRTRRILN